MTQGVECWNASGQKTLDITSRIAKFFGVAQIGNGYTGTTSSGTITDTRFTAYSGTTPFFFILGGIADADNNSPSFTISGNVLTWTYNNPVGGFPSITRPPTTFVYGII